MNHAVRYLRRVVIVFAALGAIGWGGWMEMASREPPAAAPTYSVGGTLSGLESEKSLVINNNGTDDLALSANGTFAFPTPLANSAEASVSPA